MGNTCAKTWVTLTPPAPPDNDPLGIQALTDILPEE